MTKLKQITKRLGIEAAIVLAILAGVGGIMMLTGSMATSADQKKTTAEGALAQDNSQLSSIRSQLEQSGQAEKRFVEIQLKRSNLDFSSTTEALKEWARSAKTRYRFANNFKLNLPPQKPSDKAELSGLAYDIAVREGITMELEAISDLHVYSFVNELQHGTPGLVRLQGIEVERKGDMMPQAIAQMMGGMNPNLVSAKIKFNWIGVNPKEETPAAGAVAPNPDLGAMP